MKPLAALLVDLADAVAADAGGEAAGARMYVQRARVALPLEVRLEQQGLVAAAPRGLLATGFDPQLGHVAVGFALQDAGTDSGAGSGAGDGLT